MRKLKLFITTLALLGGVISGNATDWVGNEVGAGTYYLYNIGADRYLSFGENWGSRAIADHAGIPVTLAAGSGTYTIITNVVANGNKLFVDGYMDGGSDKSGDWVFTDQNVDGKKVYTLNIGDKYLYWDGGTDGTLGLSVGAISGVASANTQWQLVTEAERNAAFIAMNATEAKPLDITYRYIQNPNTTYFTNVFSTSNSWTAASNAWDIKGANTGWWDGKDNNGEVYNKNFDNYISLSDLPNGEYEFGVVGFYRDGSGTSPIANYHGGTFNENVKIYANTAETALQSIGVSNQTSEIYANNDVSGEVNGTTYYIPNSQLGAALYFIRGKYPWQRVRTVVTDGTLRFGVKKESTISTDWTVVDKFYISYLGPTIAAKAVALPDGDMTADTWYYFDVAIDGKYNLALTTLADIVYTTDNTILYENQNTVTANFSNTNEVSLTAGRYYVKSASVQTLSVAAASYSYEVGTPTPSIADGSYQKSITTLTLNYADAATNDPSATFAILDNTAKAALKLAGSTVAEGTLSLDGNVLTATFSETALSLGSTYTLELAANVVGYAGQAANTAVSLTVNTPVVADGFYYLKTTENKYLSRGGNYNTQAIADNYGIPMRVTTNDNGITEFIFIDNWFHLFDANGGNLYTDNNTANDFAVVPTEGGYFVVNRNTTSNSTYDGKVYLDASDGNRVKVSTSNSTVWLFEDATTTAHKTQMQALKNAQAAAVATSAGISASTQAALASELASNYGETAIAITGTGGNISESYQKGASNSTGNELAVFEEETVNGLTPGLYCLSVKAFERITWPNDVNNAGGAAGLTYVYANDQKVQLYSLFDYPSNTQWDGDNDVTYDNKYYANNKTGAQAAFDAGNYINKVYVWVVDEGEGTGSIKFGIKKPNRYGNDDSRGAWICYNNFSLTHYVRNITITEDATSAPAASEYANVTLNRAFNEGWNAVCLPFATPAFDDCEIAEFVGETGSGNNVTLNFNKVTAFEANKPYLVYFPSAVASGKVFEGVAVNPQEVKSEGTAFDFMGTYTVKDIAAGDYVVSGGKLSKASSTISLKPTRTYFTPKTGTTARIAGFTIGGVTTGISDIFPDEANAAEGIYNMQGQKVSGKVQKGVYIVNGKKVIK